MIQEDNYTASEKTDFIFAGSTRVAEKKNGVVKYFHGDHLASSRVITNASGASVGEYKYAPFGTTIAHTGVNTDYEFTGKHIDGTGLYYFGARYYDPEIGRWTAVDPARQDLNWYVYCFNNPLKMIDPDGKDAIVVGDISRVGGAGHMFVIIIHPENGDGYVYSFGPDGSKGAWPAPGEISKGVIPAEVLESKDDTLQWLSKNSMANGQKWIDKKGKDGGLGDVDLVWVPLDYNETYAAMGYAEYLYDNPHNYLFLDDNCVDMTLDILAVGGEWIWCFDSFEDPTVPNTELFYLDLYYDYDPYDWGDQ